jgi:hypothetical protein
MKNNRTNYYRYNRIKTKINPRVRMLVLGFKNFFRRVLPKLKFTLMQTGGCPNGNPLLMVIETNGGRAGMFGVIFLIFIDEAQAT